MNLRVFVRGLPFLPITVLIFYLVVFTFWQLDVIPSPSTLFDYLETVYDSYGFLGLFMGSFLEGIVYVGLYFPGSIVVALAVILSDGGFISLLTISVIVAIALFLTSIINYSLGASISSKKLDSLLPRQRKRVFSKGLVASILHPNILALYFFNLGVRKQHFGRVFLVPLLMIPYGLAFGYLLFLFKGPIETNLDNPYVFVGFAFLWILISLVIEKTSQ